MSGIIVTNKKGFREGFVPLNERHWKMVEEYESKTGLCIEEMDESSAGCIIFSKNEDGKLVVLLVEQNSKLFGFPKGHVDPGEDDVTAAIRETLEETGVVVGKEALCLKEPLFTKYSLACKLHANHWVHHPAYPDEKERPIVIGHKVITLLCGFIPTMQEGIPQEGETLSVRWFDIDEASDKLDAISRERFQEALSTNFVRSLMNA